MKLKQLIILLVLLTIGACQDPQPSAGEIMNKALEAHGTAIASNARLEFDFRGIAYAVERKNGNYVYERHLEIDSLEVVDRLNNQGFTRSSDGEIQMIADSLKNRYAASLNSVVYFAQLPFGLDGPAINLRYLGQDLIKGKTYHEIEVTFDEEGGGEDHDDIFVYWVDAENFLIDFLAYSYCEQECGYRFRESVNRRNLNGVIVQDYNNYKALQTDPTLSKMDDLWEEGKLEKISEIKLERAKVKLTE
ncbi:DUF6503 family protein [Nonlabens xiamenensis]|uniref:DUF6503 family protein n=1 Tax=Nonlabens xiamenensis TaxID=2341043 RepID=UPI000F60ED07|nr:DUF6503 family protein [Nonlabens xiamenensis]